MNRRVYFLNRFFYPDHSSTSQILSDLAFHLAGHGEEIGVITSRICYDHPHSKLPPRERINNVEVYRVATTQFGRHWLIGRLFDYFSFYLSVAWALLRVPRKNDTVVAMTDPPMLSLITSLIAPLARYKTVNWVQDVYPEIAAEAGVPLVKGAVGKFLTGLRNASLRSAAANVVIGSDMKNRLVGQNIPEKTFRIIENWCDDEQIIPVDRDVNELRKQWGMDGKFVVAYSGNLGWAHDCDTFFAAAERLRQRDDIVFLFVGSGHGMLHSRAEVARRNLPNVRFMPYQPRAALSQSLGTGDVHWLSLKSNMDGLLVPSKFYGIAAAGRPIIVVGTAKAELALLVEQYKCGFQVELGDGEKFAAIIEKLAVDPAYSERLGANARAMLEERFTKLLSFDRWRALLREMAVGGE